MDAMEEIRETFFIECEELLETLESGLISMSEANHDDETVNAVFRAVHSIKGGAGAFGLDALVDFSHKFENVLDLVRSEKLSTDHRVMDVLLRSGDTLSDLVQAARDGNDAETETSRALIDELKSLYAIKPSGGENESASLSPDLPEDITNEAEEVYAPQPIAFDADDGDTEPVYAPQPLVFDELDSGNCEDNKYAIKVKPHPELYAHGSDLTLLLRAVSELGELEAKVNSDLIPDLSVFSLEKSLISVEQTLSSQEPLAVVQEIFDFVDTECDIDIRGQIESPSSTYDKEDLSDNKNRDVSDDLDVKINKDINYKVNSDIKIKSKDKSSPEKAASAQAPQSKSTVRVDVSRVDRLVNLVGELVVTQAGISEFVERAGDQNEGGANNALEEFKQLTRELQESVMSLRTQPVKSLFQRMQRISRESAAAAGKTVKLSLIGEATEVDKTVIERLSDPLTHMIRNAIDHGLESTEDRSKAGKDPVGVVTLSAAHRSGRVVIDISDDGGGINRDRVKAKAVEKGLVKADAILTNAEIDQLLFAPGFSTAAAVTNLSGRGVGMDVVKRSIQALGGKISISSQEGAGTTFSISLPLTLAVLDGMIIQIDQHTVVIPLTAIVETHKPTSEQILEIGGEDTVLSIRGNLVPVVDVGLRFGYRRGVEDVTKHVAILVESEDGCLVALIVDDIVDQRQVVIKGLDENYGEVQGIAAATILGDGTIALILDTEEIIGAQTSHSLALEAVA
ncbi:MAG: chemotaxis protein CheA [Pseudomonadota bacterium]